jgi:hypothetical protein
MAEVCKPTLHQRMQPKLLNLEMILEIVRKAEQRSGLSVVVVGKGENGLIALPPQSEEYERFSQVIAEEIVLTLFGTFDA